MKKQIFWLLAAVLCVAAPAFSQEKTSMPSFEPEIRRVAVFKNGYAFTYREGEATVSDGWTYTTRTPIGVLGTVWGYTTAPNTRVVQLLASESEKREIERVTNLVEFLVANEGAQVRVQFLTGTGQTTTLEGVYQVVSRIRDFKNIPVPQSNYESYDSVKAALFNEMVIVLKTERGNTAFNASRIESVEVIGQTKWDKPKNVKENRLALKVEGAANNQKIGLGIAALERGIRWIPAYRVEVKGEPIKEAKLELEAMLINELADLQNSEVFFVVGVPSFLFQENLSPLSMKTAFAGVSSYFNTGRRDSSSGALMTQVSARQTEFLNDASESSATVADGQPTISTEERSPALSAEQLFLYKTDKIALKKGERASLRLFSLTVPCTEVFEWTISDPPNIEQKYLGNSSYSSNQNLLPGAEDLSSRIWYALKLKNQTGMPWTTAPALSFREWKPMGQNLLTFTPVGGENILRVTPATEVIGSHKLEEKERVRQQLRYAGSTYDFDLVTIEGVINLRNVKKQPVEIALTRNFVGEIISATDNGATSREGLNLQAVNPNSLVKWNLTIPPGEKEVRYSYKVYVRK